MIKMNFINGQDPDLSAQNINQLQTNIENAINNSIGAQEYNSTATYALNDFCIHGNNVYRCTTAIATAEEWTPVHWSEISFLDNGLIILEEEEI